MLCVCAVVPLWAGSLAVASANSLTGEEKTGSADALRLVSVQPTVLFVERNGQLQQLVEVVVENDGEPVDAAVEITLGSQRIESQLGPVTKGRNTFEVYVPDVREQVPVTCVLKAAGKVLDPPVVTSWRPRRHWRVYFVPITHHDLGYTDTIENVLKRYAEFYDDVLRFCRQTDGWPDEAKYRYTVEGGWSLQHFVERRPKETVATLSKYVREGRIEIGALFGNQISCLCGHEELVRLVYPSFRLARQLGGNIATGSITDVPGLSWALPTVLSGAGVKYFFAGLPTYFEWGRSDVHTFWDEKAILRHGRPDAFWWQGPDGAKVLTYYQGSYGFFDRVTGPDSYEQVKDNLPKMLAALEEQQCPFDVMRYIHNGVDNYPPDVRISEVVRQWNEKWAYPRLVVATNAMFFEALEKQCDGLRTFRGELPDTDYVVGAASTAEQTGINRVTHALLDTAERFATIASEVDRGAYPAETIRQAYDSMLLYDEHTWGRAYPAGPGQDLAWSEKAQYAYRAAGLAEQELDDGLRRLARQVSLEAQGRHIVVFNPLSAERTDVVRLERFDAQGSFELVDVESAKPIRYQIVEIDDPLSPVPYAAQRYARGQFEKHELLDLLFVAETVPAVGFRTFRIVPKEKTESDSAAELVVGEHSIENRFYKVTVDPNTGAVSSLYDKELSREFVDGKSEAKVNQIVARWVQTGKVDGPKNVSVRKGRSGPVYASMVVTNEAPGCPRVRQEIVLYDRLKRIDFVNRVLKDSTPLLEIYFAFPFAIDSPRFCFEGTNSTIEPLRDQFPGSNSNYYAVQHWANVSGKQAGVTLSAVQSHLMEFGGLWPCYVSQAHHGVTPPDFGLPFATAEQMTAGHIYAFAMDSNFRTNFQPVQRADCLFQYSVRTHGEDREPTSARDFGWATAYPLMPMLVDGPQAGPLGARMSFCYVEPSNVWIQAIKRGDDADGLIVRLRETQGKECSGRLTIPHAVIRQAWLTNLVEKNLAQAEFDDHNVTTSLKPFGIATVRIRLKKL
jgi:hypothetical protein